MVRIAVYNNRKYIGHINEFVVNGALRAIIKNGSVAHCTISSGDPIFD